jgi:hypothetical protein
MGDGAGWARADDNQQMSGWRGSASSAVHRHGHGLTFGVQTTRAIGARLGSFRE